MSMRPRLGDKRPLDEIPTPPAKRRTEGTVPSPWADRLAMLNGEKRDREEKGVVEEVTKVVDGPVRRGGTRRENEVAERRKDAFGGMFFSSIVK